MENTVEVLFSSFLFFSLLFSSFLFFSLLVASKAHSYSVTYDVCWLGECHGATYDVYHYRYETEAEARTACGGNCSPGTNSCGFGNREVGKWSEDERTVYCYFWGDCSRDSFECEFEYQEKLDIPDKVEAVTDLGNPCGASNKGLNSRGCPEWSVNPLNLNLYIEDTPLWFDTGANQTLEFKIHYNGSGHYNDPSANFLGEHWKTSLTSYVEEVLDGGERAFKVTFPDGRQDIYEFYTTNTFISREGEVLQLTGSGYELTLANGALYIYSRSFNGRSFLDEKQYKGVDTVYSYSANGKVLKIEMFSNSHSLGFIDIEYGANQILAKDQAGRTAKIIKSSGSITFSDVKGLISEIKIDQSGDVVSLKKPSTGEWTFIHSQENPEANSINVIHPAGLEETFYLSKFKASHNRKLGDDNYQVEYYFSEIDNENLKIRKRSGTTESNQIFDLNNRLIELNTVEGKQVLFTYNEYGQLTRKEEISPDGISRAAEYEYNNLVSNLPVRIARPSVYAGEDSLIRYEYDSAFNLTREIYEGFRPDGQTVLAAISYAYDASNRLQKIDGPRTDVNDVTLFSYYSNCTNADNRCDRLKTITDAKGFVTQISEYNTYGLPAKIIDPNGLKFEVEYDKLERITSINQKGGSLNNHIQRFTYYGAKEQLDTKSLENGLTTKYIYDSSGKLTAEYVYASPDMLSRLYEITYKYDVRGNVAHRKIKNMSNDEIELEHDYMYDNTNLFNRLKIIKSANRKYSTEYRYPSSGGWEEIQKKIVSGDETYFYDAFKRLTQINNYNTGDVYLDYDNNDKIIKVTDGMRSETSFTYDDFGNQLTESSQDRGTVNYTYDSNGNVISKVDARGITINYTYDELNRLVNTAYPSNQENVTLVYDNCVGGIGRLCEVVDESGTHRYAYDLKGNLTEDLYLSAQSSKTYSTQYTYDEQNRIKEVTYPSGKVMRYTRNKLGQTTKLVGSTPTIFGLIPRDLVSERSFRLDGQIRGQKFFNGVIEEREYSTAGDLIRQKYWTNENRNVYIDIRQPFYRVDEDDGYIRVATFNDLDSPGDLSAYFSSYGQQVDFADESYYFRKNGNISSVLPEEFDVTQYEDAHSYHYHNRYGSNRLVDINSDYYESENLYQYDESGNLIYDRKITDAFPVTNSASRTYTYNNAGRLKQFTSSSGTWGKYVYDYRGLRRYKRSYEDAVTSQRSCGPFGFFCGGFTHNNKRQTLEREFIYDQQGRLIAEYENGEVVREYAWDERYLLGVLNEGYIFMAATDHLGTPRALVGSDQSVSWRWTNQSFYGKNEANEQVRGGLGPNIVMPLRFPGQYFDKESGLHYNWNRYYDPQKGRYIQADPIGLGGGLNPYVYANNQPLNYTDPTGETPAHALGAAAGFSFGIISAYASGGDLGTVLQAGAQGAVAGFVSGGGSVVAGIAASVAISATSDYLQCGRISAGNAAANAAFAVGGGFVGRAAGAFVPFRPARQQRGFFGRIGERMGLLGPKIVDGNATFREVAEAIAGAAVENSAAGAYIASGSGGCECQ